ncbi:hypothetical protein DI487_01005 [Flavobacterium sediminis]|uniref:DUF6705 domain-containing protein n=1 Tax=Flavobacterium sediminis TaxID=2201181 RepID=A0A2U8QR60_9FLAO|nr:DUF6705 family protein [Flavobacterium sediminis]AWM12589.1 hypothetical protein DI487_01005 [Flavobacterium sediminis]
MKKILYVLLLSLAFTHCKAQNPIIPRFDPNFYLGDVDGAYYKDVDNYLDQFVGTWMYTEGDTILKVTFFKKEMLLIDNSYYEDCLVGEFQYIEDGVEKANTLSNLDVNYLGLFDYNMYSVTRIRKTSYPVCDECNANEKRLVMFFTEPANDDDCLEGMWAMRVVVEGGVQKLKVQFRFETVACGYKEDGTPSTADYFSIPFGDYTLIKQ